MRIYRRSTACHSRKRPHKKRKRPRLVGAVFLQAKKLHPGGENRAHDEKREELVGVIEKVELPRLASPQGVAEEHWCNKPEPDPKASAKSRHSA